VLCRVLSYVERGRRPSPRERAKEPAEVNRLLRDWDKLTVRDGILYRVARNVVTKNKTYLYVVPSSLRIRVLKGVHDEAGHQGQQRTLYLVRQRFYWLGLGKDVVEYVRRCRRCVVAKSPDPEARAPLENIRTSEPLELVCVDFWTAEDSSNRSLDVLVVTDHFTKMAHAFLCPNQSAKAVAHQLWHNYFSIYGFSKRIHSDQGANFESALIAELLEVSGVQISHTTPYHPMGNGSCERMNRTLGNMIRALPPKAKQKWPTALKSLTFAYNCTVHETTGYPPFLLMFGRVPRLPVDLIFGTVLDIPEVTDYDRYIQSLRTDLKEAIDVVKTVASKQLRRHAELYNRKVRGAPVEMGDRVLLVNKGERGKRKLADRWENVVYVVTGIHEGSHTFRIQNPSTGQEKVVHRNLIMPVNFLPLCDPASGDETEVSFLSESDDLDVEGASVDVSEDSSDYRTRVWVSGLPSALTGGTDVEDPVSVVDEDPAALGGDVAPQSAPASVWDGLETIADSGPGSGSVGLEEDPSCGSGVEDLDPSRMVTSTIVDTVPVQDTRSRVMSRAGRLFKPVNRLIEMMHQRIEMAS